ncbi:MAG: tRNA-Thr(GGU) m(6)t(6)A37 methyltransferase TsaA [Desulforhopalus sp.]|jgi:tRNA-Thr(GGU) m(6)t(6)A37 methyltransferase TsaA
MNIDNRTNIEIQPIGVIHSCFTEKFGIPRQPGMVPAATATLELFPPYNREEVSRGLAQFSHVWIHFLFHECVADGWKNTVRPPWLGGKKRVGVLATRSPHRPNHLGLSVVRLDSVVKEKSGICLKLSGVDLLDKTPVIDVKPYVPYSDSILSAECGYAKGQVPDVEVRFSDVVLSFCENYSNATGRNIYALIEQMVKQDPRPAKQKGAKQTFGMLLWDVNVRWSVAPGAFQVESCEYIQSVEK